MDAVPPNAVLYLPVLISEIRAFWPTHPQPVTSAAQIEAESCITLKHRRCWNPYAELKTPRENGVGFGQLTIAYNRDGSVRFNVFEEVKLLDPSLRSWTWEDRYNAKFQLRAMILKMRQTYTKVAGASNDREKLAFSYAAYNGGNSGVTSDRLVCAATKGCDKSKWFGHVEFTSNKSKIPAHGYGRSFYQINREYVTSIMGPRKVKYAPYFM